MASADAAICCTKGFLFRVAQLQVRETERERERESGAGSSTIDSPSVRRASSGACRPVFLAPSVKPYMFEAPAIRSDVRSMRLLQPVSGSDCGQAATLRADSVRQSSSDKLWQSRDGNQQDRCDGEMARVEGVEVPDISVNEPPQAVSADGARNQELSSSAHEDAKLLPAEARRSCDDISSPSSLGGGEEGAQFRVAAGSFQCVWFISLTSQHQNPVVDWWRKNFEACSGDGRSEAGPGCVIATSVAELPQLTAAPKLTPAERRLFQMTSISVSSFGVEEGVQFCPYPLTQVAEETSGGGSWKDRRRQRHRFLKQQ